MDRCQQCNKNLKILTQD